MALFPVAEQFPLSPVLVRVPLRLSPTRGRTASPSRQGQFPLFPRHRICCFTFQRWYEIKRSPLSTVTYVIQLDKASLD
ncbi:MAG: hypothetical protein ACFB4I_00420 [Cyanophyceae cyanobacterium]